MATGGHFGWPKITFDRISRHFRSILSFYLFFYFLQNGHRRPVWMTENHFRLHFSPFQINGIAVTWNTSLGVRRRRRRRPDQNHNNPEISNFWDINMHTYILVIFKLHLLTKFQNNPISMMDFSLSLQCYIYMYRVYPIRSTAPNRSTPPFLTAMCPWLNHWNCFTLHLIVLHFVWTCFNKSYNKENL